jgi:Domain of unknown function (DUF6894)
MPRYHFHFASRGGEQVADPEGVELDDLRAAHRHAMKLIRRTALFTSRSWNAREWSVQVVDGEHRWSVLTVLFPVAEHTNAVRVPLRAVSAEEGRGLFPLTRLDAAVLEDGEGDKACPRRPVQDRPS